jgi:hexokinase
MNREWIELMDTDKTVHIRFHSEVPEEQLLEIETRGYKLGQIAKLKFKISENTIRDYFRKNPSRSTYILYIKRKFIRDFPMLHAFDR